MLHFLREYIALSETEKDTVPQELCTNLWNYEAYFWWQLGQGNFVILCRELNRLWVLRWSIQYLCGTLFLLLTNPGVELSLTWKELISVCVLTLFHPGLIFTRSKLLTSEVSANKISLPRMWLLGVLFKIAHKVWSASTWPKIRELKPITAPSF